MLFFRLSRPLALRRSAIRCVLVTLCCISGCSPSLYPLYRDYEVLTEEEPVLERLRDAFEETGWQTAPPPAPNAVTTQEKRIRSWGLYRVMVSIEAVPVGRDHVRLFVHPYRHYITGSRSKIAYLKGGIRRAVLRDLENAFESRGLVAVGTGRSRDRESVPR